MNSRFRNKRLSNRHVMNEIASVIEKYASPISNIVAPRISGMDNRNENFAAFSLFIPENIPAEIVIPDLETPGNSANI